jgi:hypothetical protein
MARYFDGVRVEPYFSAAAVTPSDATTFPATRALWVGGAGAVAVVFADGSSATLSGVPAGTLLPLAVTKVMATGTTATLIVSLT